MSPADDSVTLAVVVERIDSLRQAVDKIVLDHEARIRRLEAWAYALPVTALTAAGAIVVALVK